MKAFLIGAGLGAAAALAASMAMPRQMAQGRDAMGHALHKAEQCVCGATRM